MAPEAQRQRARLVALPAGDDHDASPDAGHLEVSLPRVAPLFLGGGGANRDRSRIHRETGRPQTLGGVGEQVAGRLGAVGDRPHHDLALPHFGAVDPRQLLEQRRHLVGQRRAGNGKLDPFHWGYHDAPMAYGLYVKDTDKKIGVLSEEQLEELIDLLEEEDSEDRDYYIDADVLEFMEQEGASAELLNMLRPHITDEEGVEIEWREEPS